MNKQRSHYDDAHLYHITTLPTKKSINFLHLMVSEIKRRQDFKAHGHDGKVKGQVKVTL